MIWADSSSKVFPKYHEEYITSFQSTARTNPTHILQYARAIDASPLYIPNRLAGITTYDHYKQVYYRGLYDTAVQDLKPASKDDTGCWWGRMG